MRTYEELKSLIEKRGVHDVFGDYGEGWYIEQSPFELAHFLVAMQELGVASVLEIGTGWRAGLARFLTNDMGWRVVSMDKNQPVASVPNVQFLMGRSEILRPLFDGQSFDLVIIDADHSYEAVKRDSEMYVPLADKAVMFHDIAGLRDCEGAARYWSELKSALPNAAYEIIAEGDMRGGIGWVDVEKARPQELVLDLTSEQVEEVNTLLEEEWSAEPEISASVRRQGTDEWIALDDAVHGPVEPEVLPAPKKEPAKRRTRKKKTDETE